MAARDALDRVDDGISEVRLVSILFLFVGREPVQEGGCGSALSGGFSAVEDEVATRCCCWLLSVSFLWICRDAGKYIYLHGPALPALGFELLGRGRIG